MHCQDHGGLAVQAGAAFGGEAAGKCDVLEDREVGDEVEYLGHFIDGTAGENQEWFAVDWGNGDREKRVDFMNENPELYRHADINLRDAPE